MIGPISGPLARRSRPATALCVPQAHDPRSGGSFYATTHAPQPRAGPSGAATTREPAAERAQGRRSLAQNAQTDRRGENTPGVLAGRAPGARCSQRPPAMCRGECSGSNGPPPRGATTREPASERWPTGRGRWSTLHRVRSTAWGPWSTGGRTRSTMGRGRSTVFEKRSTVFEIWSTVFEIWSTKRGWWGGPGAPAGRFSDHHPNAAALSG